MKDNVKKIVYSFIKEIDENINELKDPTVEKGTMGIAIFYFYCYKVFKNDIFLKKGEEMIERSIDLLSKISNDDNFSPAYRLDSLANVISSFGKGLLFIENKLKLNYSFDEYLVQIIDSLDNLNDKTFEHNDYSIFSGKLAFGYFFLNNYLYRKDKKSKTALLKIYDCLKRDAKYDEGGVYWVSPRLNNLVYLGISHGSAMIVNFITKLLKFEIIKEEEKDFLKNAVDFIYSKKRDLVDGYFPNTLSEKEIEKTQFSLCYGDLGIIYALNSANSIINNEKQESEILSMLSTSMKRKNDINFTPDASIIYGASGIYNIFNSLNEENKINYIKQTQEYWYNEIINSIDNGNVCTFESTNNFDLSYKYSFGWGMAGIGISLMIGSDYKLPPIDELLFIGV